MFSPRLDWLGVLLDRWEKLWLRRESTTPAPPKRTVNSSTSLEFGHRSKGNRFNDLKEANLTINHMWFYSEQNRTFERSTRSRIFLDRISQTKLSSKLFIFLSIAYVAQICLCKTLGPELENLESKIGFTFFSLVLALRQTRCRFAVPESRVPVT